MARGKKRLGGRLRDPGNVTKEQCPTNSDAFVSYNSHDGQVVQELVDLLRNKGISVFFDQIDLKPGDRWQERLEVGLVGCSACLVCLGPRGLGPWQTEEVRTAIDTRVRSRIFRIIPVVLPGHDPSCPKPLFLERYQHVDFGRGIGDREPFEALLGGIRLARVEASSGVETTSDDEQHLSWLLLRLENGHSAGRIDAALELGERAGSDAVKTILRRWPLEPDPTVRHNLAMALGMIGDEAAELGLRRLSTTETTPFVTLGLKKALEQATQTSGGRQSPSSYRED